ncbi:COG2958 family protein [Pontibacter roseus]|uniref:COG2958 family protein n=1 Tax=Pontibacter roseus TaxID=336989 RepID=UPI00036F4844|nr:HTH domain-containing protein [Pontibacter roseus]
MTFIELAEKVLAEQKQPLTANEIWQFATDKGYDQLLNSNGKTPWATLGAQIYVNARDNNKTPFDVVGTRPKRFYLKKLKSQIDLKKYEDIQENVPLERPYKSSYLEKDLHAFLTYYAFFFLRCYTKTINHSTSGKKEFGEWVHPDIVGCYFPIDEWKNHVLELSSAIGNISIRILSFELKRQLSFSNLRESFFQTVSNSSWANEGYLVASEISKDEDFMNELTRLSSAFGIGVIKLNIEDPNSTEIILPAKFRENLDWETINKLAMNKDFEDFLKRIKVDITSREIRKEKYDKILESEELVKRIAKSVS